MARPTTYSRKMILKAAVEMIREQGIEKVNARSLGKYLGCSSRPLFTAFKNMEDVVESARHAATEMLMTRMDLAMGYVPAFKMMVTQIVLFAHEEPNLFAFLFLQPGQELQLRDIREMSESVIMRDYQLNEEDAKALFNHLWYFVLGTCSMISHKAQQFSEDELLRLLEIQFAGILQYYRTPISKRPTF